jgi:hypothetical protein
MRPDRKLTIAVDFDGVLHSYTTREYPFNPLKVLDPPVPGMLSWFISLVRDGRFNVCIFSTRNSNPDGPSAMMHWMVDNGVPWEVLDRVTFPLEKPPAHVTIDDRALQFTGRPIPLDEIADFSPWNHPR